MGQTIGEMILLTLNTDIGAGELHSIESIGSYSLQVRMWLTLA
jgi:hypothetical protein